MAPRILTPAKAVKQIVKTQTTFLEWSAPALFGGNKGIARMGQAVDHCVEVMLETAGRVHAFGGRFQAGVREEASVFGQRVEAFVGRGGRSICPRLAKRFDLDQRPDRLANRHEL